MLAKFDVIKIRRDLKNHLGKTDVIVTNLTILPDGRIFNGLDPFAVYKYFEGIEEPLFRFVHKTIYTHLPHARYRDLENPPVSLVLSPNGLPGILLFGDEVTQLTLVDFILKEMCNHPVNVRARMRVLSNTKDIFEIEFWEPKYVQEWLHILNAEYKPDRQVVAEQRRYPAYWIDKEVFYAVGEVTYRVRVVPRVNVRTNGHVDVEGGRLQMFHYDEGGSFQFTLHNSGLSEKLKKGTDSGNRLD